MMMMIRWRRVSTICNCSSHHCWTLQWAGLLGNSAESCSRHCYWTVQWFLLWNFSLTRRSTCSSSAILQPDTHTTHTHTYTHPFNGPFYGSTQVSQYQKGKPIWILLKQETVSGSGISWAICKSALHSQFFTGRMPFLLPNQQRQSTHTPV